MAAHKLSRVSIYSTYPQVFYLIPNCNAPHLINNIS